MKTFLTEALLLLLQALLALSRYPEGTHFAGFYQALFTLPVLPEPQFICIAIVDDIQYERFNNKKGIQRMEHTVPWRDQKEPAYWDESSKRTVFYIWQFRLILEMMLQIYNYSTTGYQTVQMRSGCYVRLQGDFSHGVLELSFNDHDYIRLNEDMETWTTVGKVAEMIMEEWGPSGIIRDFQTNLVSGCVEELFRELEYGKGFFLRKDTPKVHVTCKVRPDKKITLRCWAFTFYPAEITLTWVTDGGNQTSDMEVSETRPSGDGTFQKWAAVVVHSGEEHRYTCHVNHVGLPEPMTLRWEPPETTVPFIVIAGILGALLMGALMTFLIWKRKTRG